MKFGLQEYAVYYLDPVNWVKTYECVMAISPEDAYLQLEIRGLEPIAWVTEDAYGDYEEGE